MILPVLEAIHDAGGAARAKDVAETLANRFALPGHIRTRTITTGDGQRVDLWRRHVRFAQQKAKALGYVTNDDRGQWQLTDEGQAGLSAATGAIIVTIYTDAAGHPHSAQIDLAAGLPTVHTLVNGDARDLSWIPDGTIPLIVTSCPYFDLKRYESVPGQLAEVPDYDTFLTELDAVWRECFRVLAPGGRLACNVGDVLRARKTHGSHHVLPLHADILVRSRLVGFQALTGILWQKRSNCAYEQGPGGVLGKPGQPNGVIKSELEHLLFLKKPGPYRQPSEAQRAASRITKAEYAAWYRPIWDEIPGVRADRGHPAPFPLEIPSRLIRMFSFTGDTVLDPFAGHFTTAKAAGQAGRNSISVEIAPTYFRQGLQHLTTSLPLAA